MHTPAGPQRPCSSRSRWWSSPARRVPAAARRRARTGPVDLGADAPIVPTASSTRRSPTCRRTWPPRPTTRTPMPSSAWRTPRGDPPGTRRTTPRQRKRCSVAHDPARRQRDALIGMGSSRTRSTTSPTACGGDPAGARDPRAAHILGVIGDGSSSWSLSWLATPRMVRMRPDIAPRTRVSTRASSRATPEVRSPRCARPRGGLPRRCRVGELPARRSLPAHGEDRPGRARVPAKRGAVAHLRAAPRGPRARRVGTREPRRRDPRVPMGGRAPATPRVRDRARRPVHRGRTHAAGRRRLRARRHRGHAVPRERRQRGCRAAVRGRPRRSRSRACGR